MPIFHGNVYISILYIYNQTLAVKGVLVSLSSEDSRNNPYPNSNMVGSIVVHHPNRQRTLLNDCYLFWDPVLVWLQMLGNVFPNSVGYGLGSRHHRIKYCSQTGVFPLSAITSCVLNLKPNIEMLTNYLLGV